MKVLVCGDREWKDKDYIFEVLDQYDLIDKVECIIEGDARGADRIAAEWAISRGIPVFKHPAQWNTFGKGAGPIRNAQMLDEGKPDVVIAFHPNINESKGTKNMISQCEKKKVKWLLFEG